MNRWMLSFQNPVYVNVDCEIYTPLWPSLCYRSIWHSVNFEWDFESIIIVNLHWLCSPCHIMVEYFYWSNLIFALGFLVWIYKHLLIKILNLDCAPVQVACLMPSSAPLVDGLSVLGNIDHGYDGVNSSWNVVKRNQEGSFNLDFHCRHSCNKNKNKRKLKRRKKEI